MADQSEAMLVVEKGIPDVSVIPLARGVSLLGKSSSAEIFLDNAYVSRRHAQIVQEDGGLSHPGPGEQERHLPQRRCHQ